MTVTGPARTTDLLGQAAACLGRYDIEGLARFYRPEVMLDASVPLWRFQLQGRDAVLEALREELEPLGALDVRGVVEHRAEAGMIIEVEVHYSAADGPHCWREVHLLLGDADGIAEHRVYCTGIWDPATIERHAVEGTMVRR